MKNILIITESVDINDSSGVKANISFIRSMISDSFDLFLVHTSSSDIKIEGIKSEWLKVKRLNLYYILSVLFRYVYKFTKFNLNDRFEKIFGFSPDFFNYSNLFSDFLKSNARKHDYIITLSKADSFRPHYAMANIPELAHKWIAYIHDPYPFHYYPRPYNWVKSGYKQKENFFRKLSINAHWVVFPSLLLKNWMSSYFPELESKSFVIPHQMDNQVKITELPAWFRQDKFNVLHAGNLLKQRDPKYLVKAFLNFIDSSDDFKRDSHLHLIGNHDYHSEYLSEFKGHQNVNIQSYVKYDLAIVLQQKTNVNIIMEAKSEISPFLPGKFPQCLHAKIPILLLGPYYSESKRLLGEDYPFWAEVDDVEHITSMLIQLYLNWKSGKTYETLYPHDLQDYFKPNFLINQLSRICGIE